MKRNSFDKEKQTATEAVIKACKLLEMVPRPQATANVVRKKDATLDDPSELVLCQSFETSHSSHGDAEKVCRLLGIQKAPVPMDSQCKYGLVARGDTSLYLRLPARGSYVETIWDHAAGSLIVEEAGGRPLISLRVVSS